MRTTVFLILTSLANAGWLWPGELSEVLSIVLYSPLAVGMEITIYNPALDNEDRSSARTIVEAAGKAFHR